MILVTLCNNEKRCTTYNLILLINICSDNQTNGTFPLVQNKIRERVNGNVTHERTSSYEKCPLNTN